MAAFLICSGTLFGQENPITVQASQAVYLGKTQPLTTQKHSIISKEDKKRIKKKNWPKVMGNFQGNAVMPIVNENALPHGEDPVRQVSIPSRMDEDQIELLVNIDGTNQGQSGSVPPDPVGVIGNDFYVQLVNGGGSIMVVTDKEGNIVRESFSVNALWGQVGTNGAGDPMILWDQLAERWFLLELGNDFTSMLLALSETDDPTGSWQTWKINSPGLPDYPKIAIWPNGYYITTNEFTDNSIPTYVVDRQGMLNGDNNLNFQRVLGIPKFNAANVFQVASAANWDGDTPPPAETPLTVIRIHDDAWGQGEDRIELFEFIPDFENPNNTQVNGPINLPTAAFDANLCPGGNIFDCLTQGNGSLISALQQVIMFRPQYRKFASYEAIVLNFSVDVNGNNQAGVRWMELRKSGTDPWSIYQESTYAPDATSRWMGSIAMDGAGNIAMGYSVIDDNTFPGMRITGRRAFDPLGVMTLGEVSVAEGSSWNGSQRWGDYSSMTVDPLDQTTFWFTAEYAQNNGNWGTRITSFLLRRDSIDAAPRRLDSPMDSPNLTATEPITATFTNPGILPIANYNIGVTVDDILIEKFLVTDTLQPDSFFTHTFSNTADLSVIKEYEIKLFTELDGDSNDFNDTLRFTVEKIPRFDATIVGINGLDLQICDTIVDIEAILENNGTELLTSATISYRLNGGFVSTIDWTGNLASGEQTLIPITISPLLMGSNAIEVAVSEPNGIPDERPDNDAFVKDIEVILEGLFVTLTLQFDNDPEETSWEIRDLDQNLVHRGANYTVNSDLLVIDLCLQEGCYIFTIFDTFADGICCQAGNGFYEVTSPEGFIIAQGDNFGGFQSDLFCVPFVCELAIEVATNNETAPGQNNASLFINALNDGGGLMYSINGGAEFQSSPFFSGLSGGDYDIVVTDDRNCEVRETITINTCTLSFTAAVENISSAGASDGSITITADTPFEPVQYSIDGGSNYQDSPVFENLPADEYEVTVLDGAECFKAQDVEVLLPTDVQTTIYGQRIEMNPNPTTGLIQIKATGFSDELLIPTQIIDMTGKVIERGVLTRYNEEHLGIMSVHIYPAGIYFLRLDVEGNDPLFKIVKQ